MDGVNYENNNLTHGPHSVGVNELHLQWCTKYGYETLRKESHHHDSGTAMEKLSESGMGFSSGALLRGIEETGSTWGPLEPFLDQGQLAYNRAKSLVVDRPGKAGLLWARGPRAPPREHCVDERKRQLQLTNNKVFFI
jgi:hypothetical protein